MVALFLERHRHSLVKSRSVDTALDSRAGGRPNFLTTQWGMLSAASAEGDTEVRAALEEIYRLYCYPVYAFIRRRGYGRQDAQDLTQDFFVHHARKKFSFERTTDSPNMLDNSSDRSGRPSIVSTLLQAGRRRIIKLVCVALTVVSSFAAFGTPDVDAATYVRVRYHGGYYNGYPYRYSGYYRYRGGVYRHRYYRYGRWYYY
jgi:hypothetical protein